MSRGSIMVKDFDLVATGMLGLGAGSVGKTVDLINEWAESIGAEVVSIETVYAYQCISKCIRVWYRRGSI